MVLRVIFIYTYCVVHPSIAPCATPAQEWQNEAGHLVTPNTGVVLVEEDRLRKQRTPEDHLAKGLQMAHDAIKSLIKGGKRHDFLSLSCVHVYVYVRWRKIKGKEGVCALVISE